MKQLRAFLGLASFYRKYVPDFAVIAAPLTDATRKGNPNNIVWNDDRDHAFQELKTHKPNLENSGCNEAIHPTDGCLPHWDWSYFATGGRSWIQAPCGICKPEIATA